MGYVYKFNFNNTIGLTNNIYNIYFKSIGVYFTEYEDTVTMLLNETDVSRLIETQPIIKTENGYFELKLSDLPIKKIINITSEDSPDIIKQEIVSNSVKFVLHKDGYVILEKEFQIDMNGQNEFNFIMEKQ